MVQNNKYHGLSVEDPLDHLDQFDRICDLTKINGVSEDSFKLRLFPFSLGDKAHQWEKSLPQGSITSWDECKRAFLAKFFSPSRTAKLRNEISSFTQKANETFNEAWERFRSYTTKCPHHGFSNASLLSTLYRGALPKIRMLLDTASNGNFLAKEVGEAMELVENLAQSDGTYNEDFDRATRTSSDLEDQKRAKEMKAIHEKLDRHSTLMEKFISGTQKHVHFVGDYMDPQAIQEDCGDELIQEELNYVGQGVFQKGGFNQGYNQGNQGYRNNNFQSQGNNFTQGYSQGNQGAQQKSYTNQQQGYAPKVQFQGNLNTTTPSFNPPPGFQHGFVPQTQAPATLPLDIDLNTMFHQIIKGQTDIHNKVDCSYNDLHSKFEALTSKVKAMESNKGIPSTSKVQGPPPSKPDSNQRESCNAIHSNDDDEQTIEEFLGSLANSTVDDLSSNLTLNVDIEQQGGGVPFRKENGIIVDVVKGKDHESIGKGKSEASKDSSKEKTSCVKPSTYEPPLPFPGRALNKAQKKVFSSFKANMEKIGAPLPKESNLSQVPQQRDFIKSILENREKVEEIMAVFDSPNITKEKPKSIPKLGNPGKFSISCSLGNLKIEDALCDSGSSVNVMPLDMVKSLGIENMRDYHSTIMFGDSSQRQPVGFVEDFPLKIKECLIPTDFIVMEMAPNKELPLLLGTPFLNTTGASMDYVNKLVVLKNVDHEVFYPIKTSSTKLCGVMTIEDDEATPPRVEYVGSCLAMNVVSTPKANEGKDEPFEKSGPSLDIAMAIEKAKGVEVRPSPLKKKPKKLNNEKGNLNKTATMTLTPWKIEDGKVEYKVKCKGRPKPFASVRAIIKDQTGLQEAMSKVIQLKLTEPPWSDHSPPFSN